MFIVRTISYTRQRTCFICLLSQIILAQRQWNDRNHRSFLVRISFFLRESPKTHPMILHQKVCMLHSQAMRSFILIFIFALTFPALSQSGNTYTNARYGATARVPTGFSPMGPEATNSDGLIFRSRKGGALLTIYGADVPGRNFEAFIESQIAHEQSYNGWKITNRSVTPDWAEYSGSIGGRFLSVRTISSCNGRQAVSTKFEYNGNMRSTVSIVERSLKAGPATSC